MVAGKPGNTIIFNLHLNLLGQCVPHTTPAKERGRLLVTAHGLLDWFR